MKQVQSNNGVPALTLNYQEKKQRIKTYETCHFCTQKLPNRGSMGITRAIVKNKKNQFLFLLHTCHHITLGIKLINRFCCFFRKNALVIPLN